MFNISERSLEYAFKELYGLTPKRYLKHYRLNQVRKLLRDPAHTNRKIVEIANQCDFWHMGQFAADYRKLFGELPSETFKH